MRTSGVLPTIGGDLVVIPNWSPGGGGGNGGRRVRIPGFVEHSIRGSRLLISLSNCWCVRGGTCHLGKNCHLVGRCCSGASSALDWEIEQQEIDNDFESEGRDNIELFECGETDSGLIVNGVSGVSDYSGETKDVGNETGKGFQGGNYGRVDVRALGESLWLAKAADDVEEVLKDKGELPLQVFSSMIRGLGREKRIDSARAIVQWLRRKNEETNGLIYPNLFIYNSFLGAIKQSKNYEALDEVMGDMAREGITPNVVTYNTLMAIYLEQGRAHECLCILDEMVKAGLVPSAASYSTALSAYRRMEDGFGAVKFFVDFREKYLKGEIGKDSEEDWETEFVKIENFTVRMCYQVMRRWLVVYKNFSDRVLKLLGDMDKARLGPSRAEYERLVWACTHEEHYMVAKELYARIRGRFSDISLSVCNHLIWLMGKARKWWAALEIYEDLLDKGPKPNNMSTELIVSHFNVLLAAARKKGIWRWGLRLIDKMEEKGLKPGSREWNAVLIACSKASETGAAIQIFRRMVEKGEKPTIISYGALLSALEKGKLYDEALRVWDHMIKVGVNPNLYAYTIMASMFAGQGKFKMVDAIIKDMRKSGIEPTVVTYNAIISACVRINMGSAAYEWFHRMRVGNIQPNEVTYEMLIEALAKDGKPRIACELYLRAQNEGLSLSTKAYDAVVRLAQVYGATVDLGVLGPRPPNRRQVQALENSV